MSSHSDQKWHDWVEDFKNSFPVKITDQVNTEPVNKEYSDTFLGWVREFSSLLERKLPTTKVTVRGHSLDALLEPGSDIDLIRRDAIPGVKGSLCKCSFLDTKETTVYVDRVLKATIRAGNRETKAQFFVVDIAYDVVVGYETLKKLGYKLQQQNSKGLSLEDVMRQYPSLFEDKEPVKEVEFELQPGHQVINEPPRKLAPEMLEWAKNEIDELIQRNIVTVSYSPYASPCVVANKNGDFQLRQDYSKLNKVTLQDDFPLPHIDELLFSFSGCKFFSKIHLLDLSRQVRLSEKTKKFTAFVLPFGKFEMNRLPVGLQNKTAILQRAITEILAEVPSDKSKRVRCHFDDILIGGETSEDCFEMTHLVLQKLQDYNMRIDERKCRFLDISAEFHGRTIDAKCIHLGPTVVREVRSAKMIHDVEPFQDLIQKIEFLSNHHARKEERVSNTALKSIEKADMILDKLIGDGCSPVFLYLINHSLPFNLRTYTKESVCGSCVYQVDPSDGSNLINGYQSYTFSPSEKKYFSHDKERLAVVKALEYFSWLWQEDDPVVVYTDFRALATLLHRDNLVQGIQLQWKLTLCKYNLIIKQRTFDGMTQLSIRTDIPILRYNSLQQLGLELKQE